MSFYSFFSFYRFLWTPLARLAGIRWIKYLYIIISMKKNLIIFLSSLWMEGVRSITYIIYSTLFLQFNDSISGRSKFLYYLELRSLRKQRKGSRSIPNKSNQCVLWNHVYKIAEHDTVFRIPDRNTFKSLTATMKDEFITVIF